MADIAKCIGRGCPIKEYCYRYTAPETKHWQSWAYFEWDSDKNECKDFWWDQTKSIDNKEDSQLVAQQLERIKRECEEYGKENNQEKEI